MTTSKPLFLPSRGRSCTITDDGDALNLDLHSGPGEVRDRDQRAGREVPVREELSPDLDEAVPVPRLLDSASFSCEIGGDIRRSFVFLPAMRRMI
jgi:hypothetical protein